MELLILLAFAGSVAAVGYDGSDDVTKDPDEPADPLEPEVPVEPVDPAPQPEALELYGTAGREEVLDGGTGNDTLTGNAGDQDHLAGSSGDDELHLGADNSAEGGAGEDLFVLVDEGSRETVIEDFELGGDQLAMVDASRHIELFETEDGNGLRFIDTLNNKTILTLPDVSLSEGDILEVELYDGNGDFYRMERFENPGISVPFALDAIGGTAGDDDLEGTAGGDVIFGEGGADTLSGGEGNDSLFSGSGLVHYSGSYNHYPGDLTMVGDDGDVLFGGRGDDHLWIGPGTTATGGEGADGFHAFTNVYDARTPAAEITDFDPIEDKLMIDFPVTVGYSTLPDFHFEDAIAGLAIGYDAVHDQTLIAMDGVGIATLPGDQSEVSIAFHDDYSTDEDRWRDAAGNPISPEQGAAASVILTAQQDQSVLGTNYGARAA